MIRIMSRNSKTAKGNRFCRSRYYTVDSLGLVGWLVELLPSLSPWFASSVFVENVGCWLLAAAGSSGAERSGLLLALGAALQCRPAAAFLAKAEGQGPWARARGCDSVTGSDSDRLLKYLQQAHRTHDSCEDIAGARQAGSGRQASNFTINSNSVWSLVQFF